MGSGSGGSAISIHAPHTGRDVRSILQISISDLFQSTRPIRGATDTPLQFLWRCIDFNPRAPYGARLCGLSCPMEQIYFNPRAPYGARLAVCGKQIRVRAFQSTRPIRGATLRWQESGILWQDFNPRAPYGARPSYVTCSPYTAVFQSTRPIRGATHPAWVFV